MGYIPNEFQKLDIYKRIAEIETSEESEEMLEELIDRFGDPPKSVENLLYIAKIKSMAHRAFFTEVSQKGDSIKFALYEKAKIDVTKIPAFVAGYGSNVKFTADARAPYFTYILKKSTAIKARRGKATIQVSPPKNTEPMEILETFLEAAAGLALQES